MVLVDMKRHELKALIKECLVELLNEGLGNTIGRSNVQNNPFSGMSESINKKSNKRFDPKLDTPVAPTTALKAAVKEVAGGNSVLESILADTAKNTLTKTVNSEKGFTSNSPDYMTRVVNESAPEELFGEDAASRWASLAFNGTNKSS